MLSLYSSLTALLLLPPTILASFDCENIVIDKQRFNFKSLGGPKTVHHLVEQPSPRILHNTTFEIDICKPLEVDSKLPKDERCPPSTWICATEREYRTNVDPFISRVFPVAGQDSNNGRHLDAKAKLLKGSESHADAEKEGIWLELHGGEYRTSDGKIKQKAIIEFSCDHDSSGTEGFGDDGKAKQLRVRKDEGEEAGGDDEDGDGSDEDDPGNDLPNPDEGKALQVYSYNVEDDIGVLRLTWKTKWACLDQAGKNPDDEDGEGKKSGGWGFFTWFLIVVFLLAAAYIIFGSWLNYNRYGARGWDLIPHGDTIRDLPYIIRDWVSGIVERLKGGNSRGGYSAV